MTEFPRLLHSGSPFQRAMLEAAQDDTPSASSHNRLLLSLGVSGAVLTTASIAQAASNTAEASSPTASAPQSFPMSSGIAETSAASSLAAPAAATLAAPVATMSIALTAKWLIVTTLSLTAVAVGAVIGTGVARMSSPQQGTALLENQVAAREIAQQHKASIQPFPGVLPAVSAVPAAPTLPLPPPNNDFGLSANEVTAGAHAVSSRPSANRPMAADGLTVSDEVALVDKARDALRRGDPSSCLSLLEIRRRSVRGGVLIPEAAILRIDALRAIGQRERATQEAKRFYHDYPNSPLVERIRSLLDAPEP